MESSILKRDRDYLGHVIIGHSLEDGEGGRALALVAGMGKREVTDAVCEWEEKGKSK